jgi:hypothetical protein
VDGEGGEVGKGEGGEEQAKGSDERGVDVGPAHQRGIVQR